MSTHTDPAAAASKPAATDAAAAPAPPALVNGLTAEERYALVRSVGEECISEPELKNLIEKKPSLRCYDGFEPSGRMHIAQGIYKAVNVNKCTKAGATFVFWVADWFALMNDKMGGDLDNIKLVGQYLVEVWSAAGMNMENVEFRWSSDDINANAKEYWGKFALDIGRRNTLARIKKCCQIMGRQEGTLTAAQILYPLMQCADIFFLRADICQLGVDQRKVNMLAREYCDLTGRKLKPVILSHHMLAGLLPGQAKMSKSNPDSAIFMEDTAADVERKIMNAACPRVAQVEREINEDGACTISDDKNPCLEYVNYVILSREGATFLDFKTYDEVEKAFIAGDLTEEALKKGLVVAINGLLQPVRDHFANNAKAKELLEKVRDLRNAAPKPKTASAEATARTPCLVATVPATLRLPLSTVKRTVNAVHKFFASATAVSSASAAPRAILLLQDWGNFSADALAGEEKAIAAALKYNAELFNLFGLQAKGKVEIVLQSDAILKDPNAYFLSVIGVGRAFGLNQIEAAHADPLNTAGQVVASLMHVADHAMLGATHTVGKKDTGFHSLINAFVEGGCEAIEEETQLPSHLCDPTASPTGPDDWLYADESDLDLRRKIKKAYAKPELAVGGVIDLAKFFIAEAGDAGFVVKRKEDNGGDLTFTKPADLVAEYTKTEGALHPGDLKPAVADAIVAYMSGVKAAISTAEMKKHSTALKAAEKKAAAKKK